MTTLLIGILSVVLGAATGSVATYFGTRSTMRLELEHAYDRELRERRLERYQELFHISGCLPRYYPPEAAPVLEDLTAFRNRFHDWYFSEKAGGMFLSPAAKETFLRLLNALAAGIDEYPKNTPAGATLTSDQTRAMRQVATELRHQLTQDVGGANPPRLVWTRLPSELAPPPGNG